MGRGTLMVLLAALIWGTAGTASTYAPDSASARSIGAARVIIGGIGLLLYARGARKDARGPLRSPVLILFGAAGIAGGQLSFFSAVERSGVAISTVLTIGSAPIFAGLMSALYLREAPGRRWVISTALGVFGVALIGLSGGSSVDGGIAGLALGLCGGAGYALYATASKRLIELGNDPVGVTAACFGAAGVLLVPVLFLGDWHWLREPRGLIVALYLGLFTCAFAFQLLSRALLTVPVATAATLSLLEPLTATLLGVAWLDERLAALQWLGAGLLLLGLLVLALPARFRPAVIRPA
jgi:DME family drug/metabolite transporter